MAGSLGYQANLILSDLFADLENYVHADEQQLLQQMLDHADDSNGYIICFI